MADKLNEALWTAFTKKHKLELDDGPLLKALARFDKTDEAKPGPRLEALKDLAEQIKKQTAAATKQKKTLGDKPFAEVRDKLADLLDLAESLQKKTEAAAAQNAEGDDEDSSPVLLTSKMLPLLRELRKGEARMPVMICLAGKATSLLIMRRAIAPSRRKLLAEATGATGGFKYIVGECLFENKALTFVVQSPAGGLAKRLRQALLEQVELRLKVRVRGDDGDDEDGENEGEGEGEGGHGGENATPAPAEASPAADFELALDAWRAARTDAIATLKDLARQAAEMRDPESAQAVIQVSAVVKQLSAEPRSAEQVRDLVRWVQDDDVVIDVCNLERDIRTPLLQALAAMQRALESAE